MWFFSNDFFLVFFILYVYREMLSYHNTHVYSISKLTLWQLGVSPGIVQGVLVAWGCHVHQQPRRIVVEVAIRYMFGKDCFVTIVQDYDSGETFVRVRNFEQMKRLASVTVFVGGDSVIFTHIDRLNAIGQPSDMSPLGKMSSFRH
jgi:hypothetical protein